MNAKQLVNRLLETEPEPDEKEVKRYVAQVKPKHQRLSKGFLRYVMSTPEGRKKLLNLRDTPEPGPPSEPHQIVGEGLEDEPQDIRSEVDRLLPTKTYHLKGNSMIHAPGVIRMAQNEWRNGRKKQKAWALGVVHAWEGLPEEVYLAILNSKVQIDTEGDDAVVTVRAY